MGIKKNYSSIVFLFILITPLFVFSDLNKDYNLERIYENVTFSVEYDSSSLYFGIEATCSQWSYYDKPEPYNKVVGFNDFKKFVEDRIEVFPHLINASESNIKKMYDECLKSEPLKYTNGQIKGQIYLIKIEKDDFLADCLNILLPKINSVKLAYIGKNGYESKALVECEKRRNFLNDNEKKDFLKNKYGEGIIIEILNYRDNWFIEYLQMLYPYQGENCVRVQDPEDEEGYLIKCYGEEEKLKEIEEENELKPEEILIINKSQELVNGKKELEKAVEIQKTPKEEIQEEQKVELTIDSSNGTKEKTKTEEVVNPKKDESLFVKIVSFFKRLFS